MRQITALMTVVVLLAAATMALADGVTAPPQVREVSLFKNGLGWFVQQGELQGEGVLSISEVPAAVHGSIWLGYDPAQLTVQSLTARRQTRERQRPAASIQDMLRANIGKAVEIYFEDTSRRGVITAIPQYTPLEPEPQPYQVRSRVVPQSGEIMLFAADGRTEAIRLNDVRRVAGDATLATELSVTEERPVLEVRYAAARTADYYLSYLARDVAWAPAYRIDISDADKAGFRLQGTFINEAQDLNDVTVNFISGFPNLSQSNVNSPLSSTEDLHAFLNALGGGSGPGRYNVRGMMMQTAAFANGPGRYDGEAAYPVAGDGDYAGDLFYYCVPHVTLKQNERAAFDLLADRVPYSHLYTWQIAASTPQNARYQQRSEGTNENETVWHEIK
ncbi:MAG TPA: hypothetical protein PKM88_13840, partial [bacterium]|nr:hypothetical protein [bacterium]